MIIDKKEPLVCAICETNTHSFMLFPPTFDLEKVDSNIFSARRLPDRIHYQLNQCRQCRIIYSSPILPYEKIQHLYSKSVVTYESEIATLKKTYKNYLQKALKYLPRNPKLLEIGSGNGFFLEVCLELGLTDMVGIEPSHSAIMNASEKVKKYLVNDFFPTKKIKKESIDIICIFQTLDHIVDVNDFLKQCYAVLKKGGVILSIVHNTDGLSVKIFGEKSPIFDIEHIYLFNAENLPKIFVKNNFKPREVFNVVNTFPIRYWLRMLPANSMVKRGIIKVVKVLRIEKLPLTIAVGNIGCIAQKL